MNNSFHEKTKKGITCVFEGTGTGMKDEGAEALLEALEENTTLSHLDVQSNKLNICECCCFEKVNLIS